MQSPEYDAGSAEKNRARAARPKFARKLRDVFRQTVDFFGESEQTHFGRNVSISDVRYALESS